MPIFEYHCDACGLNQEFLQSHAEDPIAECPKCHSAHFRKLVSAAGFQLKGGGWYATDFKQNAGPAKTDNSSVEKKTETTTNSESAPGKTACGSSCSCH